MIVKTAYIDTSALAKFYIDEAFSDEVELYLATLDEPVISSLSLTEMRCMLAKSVRTGDLDTGDDMAIYSLFLNHVEQGFFAKVEFVDRHYKEAANLISMVKQTPLRTLDALHLAVATDYGVKRFATADKNQADAAEMLGLLVDKFY